MRIKERHVFNNWCTFAVIDDDGTEHFVKCTFKDDELEFEEGVPEHIISYINSII